MKTLQTLFSSLLFGLFLSLGAQAQNSATDWQPLKETADYRLLARSAGRNPETGLLRAWALTNYLRIQYTQDGLSYRSAKSLLEFDCQGGLYHGVMVVLSPGFNGQGVPVRSMDLPTPWQTVAIDTPEDAVRGFACKP